MMGMLCGVVRPGAAQDTTRYEYQLLATNRTSTMEKELNVMAQQGFRFSDVMGGETAFGLKETVVVMQKPAGSPSQPLYEYKLLATNKTSTMEKEMNVMGKKGFAYSGQTIFPTMFRGREVVVIMERPVDRPPVFYSYKLLATYKTSTMNKELNEVGTEGYVMKGLTVAKTMFGGPEVVSILARVEENRVEDLIIP